MGVLDAFTSTWSNARSTFGQGTPESGGRHDASGPLGRLQSDLGAAAPGSRWTGSAASAYDATNTEHRRVIGELASLDQRLRAQIDQSAQVVNAGRSNLDAVRKWVLDAAASVPQNASGEKMLTPIVQKGIGEVVEVVKTSNSQLNIIGASIRGLSEEYRALGDQKLGRTDPHADGTGKDGDKPEEPQNPYEKALRDAGLLKEPPTGYYKEWLDNAAKRNVPPEEIVKIAKETPYSAAEVQRIADRQEANSWSYDEDVNSVHEHGGRLMTTPNGMLMGLGGDQWQDVLSEGGGSTWGDIFMMNIDDPTDAAQQLRDVAASGMM